MQNIMPQQEEEKVYLKYSKNEDNSLIQLHDTENVLVSEGKEITDMVHGLKERYKDKMIVILKEMDE